MTRKQFIITMMSTLLSIIGLSSFLGLFSKNADTVASGRPGYGKKDYGP